MYVHNPQIPTKLTNGNQILDDVLTTHLKGLSGLENLHQQQQKNSKHHRKQQNSKHPPVIVKLKRKSPRAIKPKDQTDKNLKVEIIQSVSLVDYNNVSGKLLEEKQLHLQTKQKLDNANRQIKDLEQQIALLQVNVVGKVCNTSRKRNSLTLSNRHKQRKQRKKNSEQQDIVFAKQRLLNDNDKQTLAKMIAKRRKFKVSDDMFSTNGTVTRKFYQKTYLSLPIPFTEMYKQDYALEILKFYGLSCPNGRNNPYYFSTGSTVTKCYLVDVYCADLTQQPSKRTKLLKLELTRRIATMQNFELTEDMVSANSTVTRVFHRKLCQSLIGCGMELLKQHCAITVLETLGIPCPEGLANRTYFSTGSTVTRHFMQVVYGQLLKKNKNFICLI